MSPARIAALDRGETSFECRRAVPIEVRRVEVQGLDGPRRLGDLLNGPTLLVFLREFG